MAKTRHSNNRLTDAFATLEGPNTIGTSEPTPHPLVDPAVAADLRGAGLRFKVLPDDVAAEITAARQESMDNHPFAPLAKALGAPLRVAQPIPTSSPFYSIVTFERSPVDTGPSPVVTAAKSLIKELSDGPIGDLYRRFKH